MWTCRDAAQACERCALNAIGRMQRRRVSRTFGAWWARVVEPDRRSCLLKQVLQHRRNLLLSTVYEYQYNLGTRSSKDQGDKRHYGALLAVCFIG